MKKILMVLIVVILALSVVGCISEEQKAYEEAMESLESKEYEDALKIFEELGDYEVSKKNVKECKYILAYELLYGNPDDGAKSVNTVSGFVTVDAHEIQDAVELLGSIEGYKDADELFEKCNQYLSYNDAINNFNNGAFDEAYTVFESLGKDYGDSEKYMIGIETLSNVIGEWSGEYDDESSNFNLVDVTCTIGAPYSIGRSRYSDCEWAVRANIKLSVSAMRRGGGTSFNIISEEEYGYNTEKQALDSKMFIKNENLHCTIFNSQYGAYSMISLSYNELTDALTLFEMPYNLDWTQYYFDGGKMVLYRAN